MSKWVAVLDPKSGKTYYANMETRETTWKIPSDFQESTKPPIQHNTQKSKQAQQTNKQTEMLIQFCLFCVYPYLKYKCTALAMNYVFIFSYVKYT